MNVSIRPPRAGDEDAVFAAIEESRAELAPFMPWCVPQYSVDDARTWIDAVVAGHRERTSAEFVITTEDGTVLGACGLNMFDVQNHRANLGYWVRTSACGRGVATEAVSLLVEWARANTDFVRVEIVASVRNAASLRVAEKSGARREGTLRARFLLPDGFHDGVMFSIVLDRSARDPSP